MPAKRKPIVMYPSEQDEIRWNQLVEYYKSTSSTDGDIVRELIREKCIAILGGDTGRARTARIEIAIQEIKNVDLKNLDYDVVEVKKYLKVLETMLVEVLQLTRRK